jgi:hypothetical protein
MKRMNARERILTAMRWGEPDAVAFACWEEHLPRGINERLLRESGMGLVARENLYWVEHPNVEFVTHDYSENGQRRVREVINTPVGSVYQVLQPDTGYGTFDRVKAFAIPFSVSSWALEHFIKGPDDYRVLEFIVRDAVYHDNFEALHETRRRLGGDGVVLARLAKMPIQEMLYYMMGMERFALDYRFRRDLFDSLHAAMLARLEELYELAIRAPVEIIHMVDNVSGDVVGSERYQEYFMPVYQRLHELLAGTGKLVAVHMDGRLGFLKPIIAEAPFDIVEALTPPPVGDVSVSEAREAWPDKALWLNFTSSMHIQPEEAIEAHTRQLLEEARGRRGFGISMTEDAPFEALERSLGVIIRVLRDY